MDDNGRVTIWTALLILAGTGLAIAGGVLAPDSALYTWLLIAAWGVTLTAFNNVYGKARGKAIERKIREDERRRLGR